MGAWIETPFIISEGSLPPVAPYVGAWIETAPHYFDDEGAMSHPMWVRGLKLVRALMDGCAQNVAPYVGAWIET